MVDDDSGKKTRQIERAVVFHHIGRCSFHDNHSDKQGANPRDFRAVKTSQSENIVYIAPDAIYQLYVCGGLLQKRSEDIQT